MSDSIAITSGKGGVGKTTIAVNLSIALKKITSEIFLLDTDLGMANSHVLLGVNPGLTISDVISGEKNISDVIIPCKSGIKLISGGTAASNLLNVENKKRYSILNAIDNHLKNINNVKLVVDIPAGAEDNALVFATACDRIVIVIVGEPTSFVDSYSLLKAIFLKSSFKNYCIVVNQVENEKEGKDLFSKFQKITSKFLDVNLHYTGCVKNSSLVNSNQLSTPLLFSTDNIFLFTSKSNNGFCVFFSIKIVIGTPQLLCLETHQSGLSLIIDKILFLLLLGIHLTSSIALIVFFLKSFFSIEINH